MRTRLIFACVTLLLVLAVTLSCAQPAPTPTPTSTPTPTPTPAEVIELTLQTNSPATADRYLTVFVPWAKEIENRTNGRVRITLYPSGGILPDAQTYDALITGTVDIGQASTVNYPGRFPLQDSINMPGLGIHDGLVKSRVLWSINKKFPEVQAEYKDVKLLWVFAMESNMIQSKKPIRTLADLKGMKIRAAPGPMFEAIKALGGTPVDVTFRDVYDALGKGVIDGVATQQTGAIPWKFYDVAKYATWVDMGGVEFYHAMSRKTWDSLPKDIQKVFDELSGDYGVELTGAEIKRYEAYGWDLFVKEAGTEAIRLPANEEAKALELLAPVAAKWAADMDAKGLPGTKTLEEAKALYTTAK